MLAYRRTLVRKKAVVNLRSGRTFVGIMWAQRGPLLVLRNVTAYEPGTQPTDMDGEVIVERGEVEFIQITS